MTNNDEPTLQPDAFLDELKANLEQAVVILVQKEMIELETDDTELLMKELLSSAVRAETPKKLLHAIVKTFVNSDQVAEVYASDRKLMSELLEVFTSTPS